MELKNYFQPLIKWWWLLVAACLLASASSYIITRGQPPIYQAHTSLMVGQSINNPNPTQTQFYLEQQLAQIYAGMGTREQVRDGTMQALGLSWLPDYRVVAIPNSQLIDIFVTDNNPARAQVVATELAHQLILRTPTVGQVTDSSQQNFVQNQLDDLQKQITSTQAEIDKLRQGMGNLNSARQIADQENEITALENKLNLLVANYTAMLGNSKQGAPNSLTIVEPAELPTVPVGPNKILSVVMSAVISLILASIGAFALEFFDPTFRTRAEVTKTLPFPVLGQVAEIPKGNDSFMYVTKAPLSPIANGFRMVKTSLETAGVGSVVRSLMILSSESGEGKTTISSNLAATFAKSGKNVILVDADLHKAFLTKTLALADKPGLSDLLAGKVGMHQIILPTNFNHLMIIPAGSMFENQGELFDSDYLDHLLVQLEKIADIIIYDSPPAFVSDTMELVQKISSVVYVVCMSRTRREVTKHFQDQIASANGHVIGMVLNRLPLEATYYGKRYGKYTSYYHEDKVSQEKPKNEQPSSGKSSWLADLITQSKKKTGDSKENGKESSAVVVLPKVNVDKRG